MDLVTGIVKENWNKDMPGKLKVEYRLGEEGLCLSGWMPVVTGYAGPGYGSYFLPEVGSEVLVAFLHGSPDCPAVLGCIQGAVNTLPEGAAAEENPVKLIRTKAGWQILVNEKERTVTIQDDKAENKLNLASEDGVLTLDVKTKLEILIGGEAFLTLEKEKATVAVDLEVSAQKLTVNSESGLFIGGDQVEMNPDNGISLQGKEIELAPAKNIVLKGQKTEIKSSQEISLAGAAVSVKPSKTLEMKALQAKLEGTTLEVKGSASAKVEASGMLELKGAMVKIN